jgi:hypothetical protein
MAMGRLVSMAAAAAAAMAAGGSIAEAAPVLFDCDAGSGTYSNIDIPQPGPNYRIVGRLSVSELRFDKDWYPVANARLLAADKKSAVGIRVRRLPGNYPIELVLQTWIGGKERNRVLARLRKGEAAPFSIETTGGVTRVEAGGQSLVVEPVIGANAKIQIACSTGQFSFEDLDWSPPQAR